MSDFLTRNKPDWDELEMLVQRARKSMRAMSPSELIRLDVLYRRTTIHLSQAVTRTTDSRLISYLNGLVAAAHSLIYLPPKRSLWAGAFQFAIEGFSRLVVRKWRFHATSAALLFGGAALAFAASMHDRMTMYALLPAGDSRQPGSTPEQLLEVLRSGRDQGGGDKFAFASFLFSHNLQVGVLAMTTGALAAVPTVFLMLFNGMLLGAFVAVHVQAGIQAEMWAWILPHGVTEIGAIILCGGVGLQLGKAVIAPGLASRGESLRAAGLDAAQTCAGIAIMLLFAAVIESFLRQSHLSTSSRLAFAAGTALFWVQFFTYGYLREKSRATAVQTAQSTSAPVFTADSAVGAR
jgi:uncharacterized membrane protein SpoIIM required for sporulation